MYGMVDTQKPFLYHSLVPPSEKTKEAKLSLFIPEPVRDLFADALERLAHPLDREVIVRAFQAVERDPELLARYRQICLEYSPWTVNKFGGMAIREMLGWEKEEGNPRPALAFTTLIKTYTRLVPPGEAPTDTTERDEEAEDNESDGGSSEDGSLDDLEDFPEIRDWVTASQAADILAITRAGVHKKIMQRDFQSVHRLGDRPSLVLLRSEVERMKTAREAPGGDNSSCRAANVVNVGARRTADKTTIPEFLGRCSPEEREYYEQLFARLDEAGINYWMGVKGFSINRIFWGYPTFECRRHGLYLQLDQVPENKKRVVRNLVLAATGYESEHVAQAGSVRVNPKDLPADAVLAITRSALGLVD